LRLHIIAATLPPQVNGIGDYTAQLASALVPSCAVKILTGDRERYTPIPGVTIEPVFTVAHPGSVRKIEASVASDPPDWLLLQYNPFSYGYLGLNLHLPLVFRRMRRRYPTTRFALMVHEPFVPIISWKWAIMTIWQRWQLWMLGQSADLIFFSIEAWARRFQRWFPGKPVFHLPVGSNIPHVRIATAAARTRLGVREDTLVIGLFGTAHISRLVGWVKGAVEASCPAGRDPLILYIGPHSAAIREHLGSVPLLAEGPLPADEVSRRFAALDVYLAPFVDGVSTRRTTLMTGLQHGVATVGTRGVNTDTMIRREDGRALLLADVDAADRFSEHVRRLLADAALRERLGGEARRLYCREFAWDRLASRLLAALGTDGVAR
jgi:glycosyltransferase involved in cell wall biosynthesis